MTSTSTSTSTRTSTRTRTRTRTRTSTRTRTRTRTYTCTCTCPSTRTSTCCEVQPRRMAQGTPCGDKGAGAASTGIRLVPAICTTFKFNCSVFDWLVMSSVEGFADDLCPKRHITGY